jgi:hypothetical protein
MGFLKRLLGREKDHEQWLAEHPGKESKKAEPLAVDEDEQARARSHMEQELTEAREKRESP